MAAKTGEALTFSDDALRTLESYRWPGNVRELQNVVEQLASLVHGRPIDMSDLQSILRHRPPADLLSHQRRRSIVDELYAGLTDGAMNFWEDVHPLFISRDLTRADLRALIQQGLAASSGSYRGLLKRFGMPQQDYKALLNFLGAHDCRVDSRQYRLRAAAPRAARSRLRADSRFDCPRPDDARIDSPAAGHAGSGLSVSEG
jgi:DNA-binding NtrC family response regulator